ncbi:MAG: hypothetical protein CBD74_07805 [Saprospirales bacterium TMED214]|nr:MAG: hypothetical protein CBD74_07805 [Saprospirales bacterium TMED214]
MLSLDVGGYGFSSRRAESIVNWFIKKYLPRHKLSIFIWHRGMKRDCAMAWIGPIGSQYRPRDFEIEVQSNLDPDTYTIVLLHELWHLLQHVRGDLSFSRNKRCWKGIDCSHMDYTEEPWEVEAHKMETILLDNYLKPV